MIIEAIILSSLTLAMVAYVIVSRWDRSYINVFTPVYFIIVPAYYLLELVHIHYYGYSGSIFAYAFCYAIYGLGFLLMALVYVSFPSYRLRLPFTYRSEMTYLPWLVLGLSVLVYLPILIEFREFLFEPRQIYHRTRSGYGHIFFTSTALTFLSWILCLFKRRT
ncbi:MAG: hypothetical protein AB1744_11560, partial [Candidatus Zixiibacteriota bacterium]